MSSKAIIYGRTAYEGFAKAIGSCLGLSVKVDNGTSACIDKGGTIYMPGMNTYQTAHEFNVTCAVIVHELSHQFYRSHRLIDPNRSPLEHDCLNAVLDVADETWIDAYFQTLGNVRPGELLSLANGDALNKNHRAFGDWSDASTHAWKVLCVGILAARGVRHIRSWKRYTANAAAKLGVDAKACFRLLRRAIKSKKQNPNPTGKRFKKLRQLASALADLLKPLAPPASKPAMVVSIAVALAAGTPNKPANTIEATEQQGQDLATATAANGAGGNGQPEAREVEYDAQSYTMLSPAIQKVAQRIANDGDGLTSVDGLTNGARLGQAYRLITDGQCLARWDESDRADGVSVSVLLDCSGSMSHHLAECAGIARAFVLSMRQAGTVQAVAFGTRAVECDDFSKVSDMGGTRTYIALAKAIRFLERRAGQRWIVIITDGQPENAALTNQTCIEAAARGIRVLAVGLNCNIVMPNVVSVTASDAAHLAIELEAAAQQIEAA